MANSVNYDLFLIDKANADQGQYVVLQEKPDQQKFWGTYAFNASAKRENLIFQAPQAVYDKNTGNQSIYLFTKLDAKACFFNAAHRCDHAEFSECSGTTSTCSSSKQKYTYSDCAHNTKSIFHITTSVLNKMFRAGL